LLVLFFISIANLIGQTTYISGATGNGNFENATTLTGWTLANDNINKWWGSTTSFCVGTKGAYVGTATGNNTYDKTIVQVSHIYRSIAFILMLNDFANIKKNQFDKFFFEQLDGDYF